MLVVILLLLCLLVVYLQFLPCVNNLYLGCIFVCLCTLIGRLCFWVVFFFNVYVHVLAFYTAQQVSFERKKSFFFTIFSLRLD